MTVTREVIYDLLPVYFSGEVSADTRRLVEEFLATDPEFARMTGRFQKLLEERRARSDGEHGGGAEKRAFARTRSLLRHRNQVLGLAIGYSLAPFLFLFRDGQITFWLLRDKPVVGITFAATGLICWIVWLVMGRRLVGSDL